MGKKFSVLMSVYKNDSEEYLKEAIESCMNQTLIPSEIILVKDGELTSALDETIDPVRNPDCFSTWCLVVCKKRNHNPNNEMTFRTFEYPTEGYVFRLLRRLEVSASDALRFMQWPLYEIALNVAMHRTDDEANFNFQVFSGKHDFVLKVTNPNYTAKIGLPQTMKMSL